MKRISEEIRSAPAELQLLGLGVFLIGLHSLFLGTFIYFFTELFYRLFFRAAVENFFFVKQSGLFLVCISLFYLASLAGLKRNRHHIVAITLTKVLAVLFLLTNARLAVRPEVLLLAAALDGAMAALLMLLLRNARSALHSR